MPENVSANSTPDEADRTRRHKDANQKVYLVCSQVLFQGVVFQDAKDKITSATYFFISSLNSG